MAKDRFLTEIEGIFLLGFAAFVITIMLFLYSVPQDIAVNYGTLGASVAFVAIWSIIFAFFLAIVFAYYFLHPQYVVEVKKKRPKRKRRKR